MCKILLVLLVWITLSANAQSANSYTAAVYEHAPSKEDGALETIYKNIEDYRQAVIIARRQYANIIVFPEYGLTTADALKVNTEQYAIPISGINYPYTEQKVLQELSSIASEHGIYMVVNLIEKENTGTNQWDFYNTNLVFSNNGSIIAKYRKINLYNEPTLKAGNETVTFQTDFGVTFGILTCFDILFENPSVDILRNDRVTDVVYPVSWFSTLPFYSSLSVQHGYSLANGVNLLAADYSNPKLGNGGSGIYLADGQIREVFISGKTGSKLIVGSIPKIDRRLQKPCLIPATPSGRGLPRGLPGGSDDTINEFVTFRDFVSPDYKFKNLDLSPESIVKTKVCHNEFCCTFDISVGGHNPNEVYKAMAFDGMALMGTEKEHIRVCSILICKNNDVSTCGDRVNGTTIFKEIKVQTNVPSDIHFSRPVSLTSDLKPIASTTYCSNSLANSTLGIDIEVAVHSEQSKVLVFGIYAKGGSGADSIIYQSTLLLTILAAMIRNIIL